MQQQEVKHSPWRSVYPKGNKGRCAGISAGDHHVYMNVFQADDLRQTIEMHQGYADMICHRVNTYMALVEALTRIAELTKKRQLPLTNEINDLAKEALQFAEQRGSEEGRGC